MLESLEDRRLFASAVDPSAVITPPSRTPFALRVNFQPPEAPRVRGYRSDFGAAYGRRSNGFTYGWNTSRAGNAVYRDDPRYNSVRAQTNITMPKGTTWNVRVPNGWYEVRVLMGDPSIINATYRLDAEGKPLVKGEPYKGFPWVEGLKTVQVRDGKLTLSVNAKAQGNRLCSIGIQGISAPKKSPTGARIAWSTSSIRSPLHRAEAGAVRVGNRLYVMGGFTTQYERVTGRVDILNVKTGNWTKGAPLPGAQTHFGAASDGQYIYIAGGQYGPMLSSQGTAQAWRYDIAARRWSRFIDLPEVRFGGQMSLVNGRLHFVGGNDRTRVRSRGEHWILDLSRLSKGWQAARALPSPTDHHSQIVVKNQLYVIGGEVEHGTSYLQNAGFFRYNAQANRWQTLAPLPEASSHFEAATLTDGKQIILVAGQTNAQQLTSQVRSYDIARNRWTSNTSLPTARKAGVAWIMGNRIFYMTGDDEQSGEPRSTYVGTIR
ncbi:MAG: hypothetical protein H7144_00380 [Burkholderiales bacterium]|nr:hypothetical protein [Phycisphaerae bacterium]